MVQLDCDDKGIDSAPALEAHAIATRSKNAPEECSPSFRPEDSGLGADVLALLPGDPPGDHVCWAKVRQGIDAGGNLRAHFSQAFASTGHVKVALQVTAKTAGGNLYAAFRIARHSYLKFEEGMDKDEVIANRNELCSKLPQANRPAFANAKWRRLHADSTDDKKELGNDCDGGCRRKEKKRKRIRKKRNRKTMEK